MYDINNIVSSMFGIEMTLVFFPKLSHKKKIQLRKTKSLAAALLEAITFPRKYLCICSKQHYYSYLKLQDKFNFCHNRVVLVTILITFYNL